MSDERPVPFSIQRARPIRGPGVAEPPKTVVEAPMRQLRRQPNKRAAPEPEKPTPPPLDMIPTRPVTNGDGAATGGAPQDLNTEQHTSISQDGTQQHTEVAIPISDVLILAGMPTSLEAIKLFSEMSKNQGRKTLHVIHKLWPELFNP